MSRKRKLEDTSAGSSKKRTTSLASWSSVEDFNMTRCRQLNDMQIEPFKGPVVYWMSRDQRVQGKLNHSSTLIQRKGVCYIIYGYIFATLILHTIIR